MIFMLSFCYSVSSTYVNKGSLTNTPMAKKSKGGTFPLSFLFGGMPET